MFLFNNCKANQHNYIESKGRKGEEALPTSSWSVSDMQYLKAKVRISQQLAIKSEMRFTTVQRELGYKIFFSFKGRSSLCLKQFITRYGYFFAHLLQVPNV